MSVVGHYSDQSDASVPSAVGQEIRLRKYLIRFSTVAPNFNLDGMQIVERLSLACLQRHSSKAFFEIFWRG